MVTPPGEGVQLPKTTCRFIKPLNHRPLWSDVLINLVFLVGETIDQSGITNEVAAFYLTDDIYSFARFPHIQYVYEAPWKELNP